MIGEFQHTLTSPMTKLSRIQLREGRDLGLRWGPVYNKHSPRGRTEGNQVRVSVISVLEESHMGSS